jgi:hypothetical protein
MRKTKTFISKGYSETSVPTIVYKDDCEPCAVYVNGERQDNISYIPKVNEGVSSVQYKSEYKNNLRTLQIEGNTEQDVTTSTTIPFDLNGFVETDGGLLVITNDDTARNVEWARWNEPIPLSSKGKYRLDYQYNGTLTTSELNVVIAYTAEDFANKTGSYKVIYPNSEDVFVDQSFYIGTINPNGTIDTFYWVSYIQAMYQDATISFIDGFDSPTPEYPQEIKSCNNPILPIEYQQVEYIESTGTQYIDTGILGKSSLRIVVKTNYAEGALLGTQSNTDTNKSIAIVGASVEHVRFMASGGTQVSANYTSKTPYEIDLSITNFKITSDDGQSYTSPLNGTSTTIDYPMYVFARNIDGQASGFSKRKVYSLKIYDNETLVRDYIPCYRKSDGAIGLYDLANGVFYTNNGTGTFTKGKEIYQMSATIKGINEFDISKIKPTSVYGGIHISNVGENSITITSTENIPSNNNGFCDSYISLNVACPNIKAGKTYKLTLNNSGKATKSLYLSGQGRYWWSGTTKTITEEMLDDKIVFYGYNYAGANPKPELPVSVDIFDIMITEVQDAKYEPYIEPTSIGIPSSVTLDDGTELALGFEKLGNYANKLTIDRVNSKVTYLQNCKTRIYDSSIYFDLANVDVTEDVQQFTSYIGGALFNENINLAKCSHLPYVYNSYGGRIIGFIPLGSTSVTQVLPRSILIPFGFVAGTKSTYVPALKAWLQDQKDKGTPYTQCVVVTPTEYDLTNTELGARLLEWAKNTKNQTNIIEITSDLNVSKTSVDYAKWGGSNEI